MLGRDKVCTRATSTTVSAVSTHDQVDAERIPTSLPLRHDRFTCNTDTVFAIPRVDLHESEWIDPELVDAEVSRLVAGSSSVARNPRKCKTSTSSGYSSHSPPLSAGSYSCCTSAPVAGPTRNSAPATTSTTATTKTRSQVKAGLAVIHEGETIPRPIWPCISADSKIHHGDDDSNVDDDDDDDDHHDHDHNHDHDDVTDRDRLRSRIYACCCCSYGYSYCDGYYGQSTTSTAREVLLELSRTLNSVVEGGTSMTAEEILRHISLTVAQGINLKTRNLYEDYVYRLSSSASSGGKKSSAGVNPVNLRIYNKPRSIRGPGSPWSSSRCNYYEGKSFGQGFLSPFGSQSLRVEEERKQRERLPAVFLVPQHPGTFSGIPNRCDKTSGFCNYRTYQNLLVDGACTRKRDADSDDKKPINPLEEQNGISRNVQSGYSSMEPVYSTQLECSDGSSSNEEIVETSVKSGWRHNGRGLVRDLDFTLDGSRAERLGRMIAKAKRKRQWCRALTAIFGLVFFVLSVVVVSLSVTRGRKIFGSM